MLADALCPAETVTLEGLRNNAAEAVNVEIAKATADTRVMRSAFFGANLIFMIEILYHSNF